MAASGPSRGHARLRVGEYINRVSFALRNALWAVVAAQPSPLTWGVEVSGRQVSWPQVDASAIAGCWQPACRVDVWLLSQNAPACGTRLVT